MKWNKRAVYKWAILAKAQFSLESTLARWMSRLAPTWIIQHTLNMLIVTGLTIGCEVNCLRKMQRFDRFYHSKMDYDSSISQLKCTNDIIYIEMQAMCASL